MSHESPLMECTHLERWKGSRSHVYLTTPNSSNSADQDPELSFWIRVFHPIAFGWRQAWIGVVLVDITSTDFDYFLETHTLVDALPHEIIQLFSYKGPVLEGLWNDIWETKVSFSDWSWFYWPWYILVKPRNSGTLSIFFALDIYKEEWYYMLLWWACFGLVCVYPAMFISFEMTVRVKTGA